MNKEKMDIAILCDSILERCRGSIPIEWHKLREDFKIGTNEKGIDIHSEQYYLTENNINLLISDGMMYREGMDYIFLSDKGFATMAYIKTLGYVAKENERLSIEKENKKTECINRVIQICILIAAIATLVVTISIVSKP